MASRYDAYRFRDTKTALSASVFNAIWADLDSRIGQLETISEQLDAAITEFTEVGLESLQETILPIAQQAQSLIDDALELLETTEDPAANADLAAYTSRADYVTISYDGNGRVDTVTETYGPKERILVHSYDGNGRISSVMETWGGIQRTELFGYDGNGKVISITASEEAAP